MLCQAVFDINIIADETTGQISPYFTYFEIIKGGLRLSACGLLCFGPPPPPLLTFELLNQYL
jgi:hypothetical protein